MQLGVSERLTRIFRERDDFSLLTTESITNKAQHPMTSNGVSTQTASAKMTPEEMRVLQAKIMEQLG